jgi:hypothetical protein
MTHDLLEFAASRYRLLKSEDNWRTEKSEFYLSKIIDMAQHQFLFRQQESIPMSNRVGVWKIVLVLILLGFGFLAFYIIWRTAFNVPSQTILP